MAATAQQTVKLVDQRVHTALAAVVVVLIAAAVTFVLKALREQLALFVSCGPVAVVHSHQHQQVAHNVQLVYSN